MKYFHSGNLIRFQRGVIKLMLNTNDESCQPIRSEYSGWLLNNQYSVNVLKQCVCVCVQC